MNKQIGNDTNSSIRIGPRGFEVSSRFLQNNYTNNSNTKYFGQRLIETSPRVREHATLSIKIGTF